MGLHRGGIKAPGTSVDAVDACESRFGFSKLSDSLQVDQPERPELTAVEEGLTHRTGGTSRSSATGRC